MSHEQHEMPSRVSAAFRPNHSSSSAIAMNFNRPRLIQRGSGRDVFIEEVPAAAECLRSFTRSKRKSRGEPLRGDRAVT